MKKYAFPTVTTAYCVGKFGLINWKLYPFTKGKHMGYDLRAKLQAPIFAVADGEVIESGFYIKGGYGRRVVIQHVGFKTLYGHLRVIHVPVGNKVTAGQEIGTMGGDLADSYRGVSNGVHLHFEVILPVVPVYPYVKSYRGYCVDPLPWLAEIFLPPAPIKGEVITGVRVRTLPEVSQDAIRLDSLEVGKVYWFTEETKDAYGNTWLKLRAIRDEWSAARYERHNYILYSEVTPPVSGDCSDLIEVAYQNGRDDEGADIEEGLNEVMAIFFAER